MWHNLKEMTVDFLGISRDTLHIHFGLSIFFLVTIAYRYNSRRLRYAWLAVLATETLNEILDFHDWYLWTGSLNWHESIFDYIQTMFWPSVIICFAERKSLFNS